MNFFENAEIKRKNASLVSMYVSFAILVLIVFGIAGIKNNLEGIKRFNIKNAELQEQETKLTEKKAYLVKTEEKLGALKLQEKSINTMIPEGEDFEKYVEEIVASNSGYGFDVEKVNFTSSQDRNMENVANVNIVFGTDSENYDLEGLVKSLEKTPRLSIIETLVYSTIADKKTVKVDLKIYMVE